MNYTHVDSITSTEAQIQTHVEALIKAGWSWNGRGLYPSWGRGESIHTLYCPKASPPQND